MPKYKYNVCGQWEVSPAAVSQTAMLPASVGCDGAGGVGGVGVGGVGVDGVLSVVGGFLVVVT